MLTVLCDAGFALAFVAGELDDGAAFLDRALLINPNLACGVVSRRLGQSVAWRTRPGCRALCTGYAPEPYSIRPSS